MLHALYLQHGNIFRSLPDIHAINGRRWQFMKTQGSGMKLRPGIGENNGNISGYASVAVKGASLSLGGGRDLAAGFWRGLWQTLLAGLICGLVLGLLPGHVDWDPGKHSLRLGIPGLKYAAPLGLKKMELKRMELERTDGRSPVISGRLGSV
jgi:hypothetical protein